MVDRILLQFTSIRFSPVAKSDILWACRRWVQSTKGCCSVHTRFMCRLTACPATTKSRTQNLRLLSLCRLHDTYRVAGFEWSSVMYRRHSTVKWRLWDFAKKGFAGRDSSVPVFLRRGWMQGWPLLEYSHALNRSSGGSAGGGDGLESVKRLSWRGETFGRCR